MNRFMCLCRTTKHAVHSLLFYVIGLFFLSYALFGAETKFYLIIGILFSAVFLLGGYMVSHGYWLDMMLFHTKSIEGQEERIKSIYAGGGNSPCGKKLKVMNEDGEEVHVLLYDKILVYSQGKSKMVKGEKYRTLYHYLKYSKVVVEVEYIRLKKTK